MELSIESALRKDPAIVVEGEGLPGSAGAGNRKDPRELSLGTDHDREDPCDITRGIADGSEDLHHLEVAAGHAIRWSAIATAKCFSRR